MKKKFNYIPIQLIVPEGRIPKNVIEECEYIKLGYYLKRNVVVGQLAESVNRGSALTLWQDIPSDNGKYVFEIIVELPFFLPNFKKSYEYCLSIGTQKYCINNRHCEIITDKNDVYIFAHYNSLSSLSEDSHKINQVIKLNSLVSFKYIITSKDASSAIETNFLTWIEDCNNSIPKIISTLRYCTDKSPEFIPDCTNIGKTCPIYILCIGKNKKVGIQRFVKHFNASSLQPISHIQKISKPTIEKYLSGDMTFDEGKHLLLKSKQMYESGEYHSACILACTTSEVIMTTHLKKHLRNKGLGKNKIKEAIDNITFSQLIKLTSNFIYGHKNNIRESLIKIDKIRKIRNKLVHEGKKISTNDISTIKSSFDSIELLSKHIA